MTDALDRIAATVHQTVQHQFSSVYEDGYQQGYLDGREDANTLHAQKTSCTRKPWWLLLTFWRTR